MQKDKYYITTAIAYTSKKPHIGNSYEIVLTDAIARLKRMQGHDVFFLTGTDEHGQKIEMDAAAVNMEPQAYVDKVAAEVREVCDILNTSYDDFIRTTDPKHTKVVQKIFKKLYDQGDIYKSQYVGWYCVPDESFFTDSQLVDGNCPECGREVQRTNEETYFFKLSKYQKQLEEHIEANPNFIFPESRKREMVNNFIKPGLQDLCVSRSSFKWGVPVPFDDGHIIYVWIDALSNYITALGYDTDNPSDKFNHYWPADVHVIGKDILRFHTIYWPAILLALGEELPQSIFGHPWFLFGADKMSKSRGNVIYADELAEKIGVDGVRYYLLAEMPYAQDGTITYERIFDRFNTDLANTLGNLVNRTISMTHQYFDGALPAKRQAEPIDEELKEAALSATDKMIEKLEKFRCAEAAQTVMGLARRANKYIDETTPWVLGKDEAQHERLAAVLANLLEAIRFLGVLIEPFMPETSQKIFAQLGCAEAEQTLQSIATFGAFGTDKVNQPKPLFARLDSKKLLEEIEKEQAAQKEQKKAAPKEDVATVSYDDFMKAELRCAEVLRCEKVKDADRLLKLAVNDGKRERTIVSGIAQWYEPDALVGKKVIVVTNLQPTKIRGIQSEGMVLSADGPNDSAAVVFLPQETEPGSRIH